jgi:hypothetical protein
MSSGQRRRPKRHTRRTARGYTLVNEDVYYDEDDVFEVDASQLVGVDPWDTGAADELYPVHPTWGQWEEQVLDNVRDPFHQYSGPGRPAARISLQMRRLVTVVDDDTIQVEAVCWRDGMRGTVQELKFCEKFGPHRSVKIPEWAACGLDLSGIPLDGMAIFSDGLHQMNFRGSDLSCAEFRADLLSGVSFEGANLRGANMEYVEFDNVSFVDANVTGLQLHGTELVLRSADPDRPCIRFEGSNVTAEQIDALETKLGDDDRGLNIFSFDHLTVPEAAERLDMDPDTLRVVLWADGVQLRRRDGSRVDVIDEDSVVPLWELHRINP